MPSDHIFLFYETAVKCKIFFSFLSHTKKKFDLFCSNLLLLFEITLLTQRQLYPIYSWDLHRHTPCMENIPVTYAKYRQTWQGYKRQKFRTLQFQDSSLFVCFKLLHSRGSSIQNVWHKKNISQNIRSRSRVVVQWE